MSKINKNLAELERKLQKIEELSGRFGEKINTANLKPLEQNASAIEAIYENLIDKQRDFNSEIDTAISSFQDILGKIKQSSQGINQAKKELGGLTSIAQKLQDHQRGFNSLTSKQLITLQSQAKARQTRLSDTSKQLQKEEEELKTSIANYKAQSSLGPIQKKRLKQQQAELKKVKSSHKDINALLNDEDIGLQSLNKELDNSINLSSKIGEQYDLASASVDGISTALDKLGLGKLSEKLGIDDAKKEMGSIAKRIAKAKQLQEIENKISKTKGELSGKQLKAGFGGKELQNLQEQKEILQSEGVAVEQIGSGFDVLKGGLKSIGASLKTNLLNPTTLILATVKFVVDAFKSLDAGAGEMAKSMNITYSEALNVREELTEMANSSYDTSVNTKGLQEALTSVNAELGTSGMLSEETLTTMSKLNQQAGISYKTQTAVYKLGAATGKEYKDAFSTFQASAKIEAQRLGVAINTKQLMADMANVSAATQLSISGGVDGLAKQMTKVKALGLEFSKLEGIADSLLNFESSIEAELQAELLIGKDLNLEKARQLALNNDLAGMAEELNKQNITAASFGNMNRIQQEATAKAMGMSRDAMGEMLLEQEALKSVGKKLNDEEMAAYNAAKDKYGAEKAAQMLKEGQLDTMVSQQNLAEKFNDVIIKLQEIFQTVAVALSPILDIFMSIFEVVGPIVGFIGQMISKVMWLVKPLLMVVAAFKSMQLITKGLVGLETLFSKKLASNLALRNSQNVSAGVNETIQSRILTKLGLQDSVLAYQMAKSEGLKGAALARSVLEESILGRLILQGVNIVKNLGKMVLQTAQSGYRLIAESGIVGSITAQGLGIAKNLIKGAIFLAQQIATSIAAMATAAASTLGFGMIPVLAALAAGAAVVYAMTADDMVSEGTPGYGKRTLMGPEGAIQLNNKDTVIAGTDLFGGDSSPQQQSPIVQVSNSSQPPPQTDTNSEILSELKTANSQRSQGNSYLERDTSVSTVRVQ